MSRLLDVNDAVHLGIVLLFFLGAAWVSRRRDRPSAPPGVLWRFGDHLRRALWGRNLVFPVLAVASTVALVLGGGDRALHDLWQRINPLDPDLAWGILVHGNYWTLVVAVGLLLWGHVRRRARLRMAGVVSVQAVLGAFVLTHTLKVLTGRRGPLDPLDPGRSPFPKVEDPADFAFDFWNHSIADGRFFWPSGHTISAMALVTALWACAPRARWIAWIGYPLTLAMGFVMLDGDFHWTSDVVAALLLGWPIGRVIGTRLRAEHERRGLL